MIYSCPQGHHVSDRKGKCPHCNEELEEAGDFTPEEMLENISKFQLEKLK